MSFKPENKSHAIKIRPFEKDDLPIIQDIRKRAFAPIFEGFREQVGSDIAAYEYAHADKEQADYLESVCLGPSDLEIFVALENNRITGFVALAMDTRKSTGIIDLNAVDPDCQDKGIGTFMFEFALARMKENGIKAAKVGTGGDAAHAPARKAYEKAGFDRSIRGLTFFRRL